MAHLDPTKYAVAWIAPLEIEARAALHMLDDRHQGRFPVSRGDDYVYHAGAMGGHNIIIATLPAGQKYGTGSAAALAGQLKKFFPNLWFGLLVGVAAGLPDLSRDPVRDIRLGDVLVGLPEGESAGLLAYDLGKETEDGFQPLRHGHALATTEPIVRSAIGSIKIEAPYDTEKFLPYYEKIRDKEHAAGTFSDPGQELDVLFSLDDDGSEITTVRDCRPDSRRIRAWYGPIGSGDKLWKNLRKRNELRDKYGLIGLEMEAAGTMDQIPVGVIRGVCDYGDGHKNKIWQPYAAAMAAAYARALLEEIPARAPTQSEIIQAQLRIEGTFRQSKRPEMPPTPSILIPFGRDSDFVQASSDPQSAVDDTIVITHCIHPPCYHVQLAKNPRFTGRTSILNKLEESFFGNNSSQKVALVGLGGVGKTQIALRFACEMRERRPEYSIFWVPLLSDESAEQAFVEIAKKLGLQQQSNNDDAKALVYQHLASDRAGKWLFIIDNADDGRLISGSMENPGLEEFFPASDNGILLMTTRSGHVAEEFAGADMIEVEQMNPKEATELFRKHLTRKKELQDEVLVAKLLSYLSFLPLAITQAASYLNQTKAPLTRYLTLLQDAEKDLPSVLGREFKDTTRYKGSRNAVGKTWIVSFQQIEKSDPIAVRLLSFLSCIEPKDIPQAMIPDAGSEKMEWAVGTLCAYSFLVRQEEIDVLDMHSLVHMATRGWIEERGWRDEALCDAASHLVESFPPRTPANRRLWQKYVPHTTRLLDQVTEMRLPDTYHLYELVGRCHSIDRRFKEAAKCYEPVYWWKRAKLREDDGDLLYTEHALARAYLNDRRIEDAIEILEHVVAVRKETLNEKDQYRLASEQALASAYLNDRRIEDAIEILEHVVAVQKETLNEKDQSQLTSEHELTRAYLDDRRIEDAIEILEHMVAVRKETLNKKDQSRLTLEHELARAYLDDRRIEDAIEILEHVVAVRKETLDKKDHARLTSEHELASAYLDDRRIEDAIEILEHVVAIRKETLNEKDQSQLTSEHALTSAYLDNRRIEDAIEIFKHVVAVRKETLNEKDHARLILEHALASAYLDDRRIEDAIKILEHVVAVRKETLNKKDHEQLTSEHELARAYLNNRRIEDAIEILEHVVAVKKETLNEKDHKRLTSEHALARAYLDDRRIEDAIEILEHMVAVQKETLNEKDHKRLTSEHALARAYLDDRRIEDAIEIFEHVVAIQKRTLDEKDHARLLSEHELARAYRSRDIGTL